MAVLTQGFDLQKRFSDSEERLLKANALSQDLYRNEWLLYHIQQIVRDYQSVRAVWFDLFKLRADEALTECRKVLHGMSEGYLIVQSGVQYPSGAYTMPTTRKSAKAVAAIDAPYWRSPEAETYVQENADAVRRGVRFIRVFTYPTTTLRGMVDILERQQSLGIEVYIAPAEDLPRESNKDYLILDDRLLFCNETEQLGQRQRISIDKAEVEQMVRRFGILLRRAKKLDDMLEALKSGN